MQEKLNIAVFVDYDNIEIGLKSTLRREFDVSLALDALKERGDLVAKFAYANWGRQDGATRQMAENAVQMVQRIPSPRGDKNGADINLALDALEMAFPHTHRMGGDRPERTDRPDRGQDRGGERRPRPAPLELTQAMPLVERALQVLERRAVQPQLGLLKSTMLQLDSAFNERAYGAGSFSDFVEKLKRDDLVNVTGTGGRYVIERKGSSQPTSANLKPEDLLPALRDVAENHRLDIENGVPVEEL